MALRLHALAAGALLGLVLVLSALQVWSAASTIYHEQTGNSISDGAASTDCPGAVPYVDNPLPATGEPYALRFKVSFHGETDQARVYYTTDGSLITAPPLCPPRNQRNPRLKKVCAFYGQFAAPL